MLVNTYESVRIHDASIALPSVHPSKTVPPWLRDTLPDTAATGGEAVPSRFKRVLDKATGKHYYYDKETKETVRFEFVLTRVDSTQWRRTVTVCV